jgi:hypothetical protein
MGIPSNLIHQVIPIEDGYIAT